VVNDQERAAYVAHRLERAKQTLAEADTLYQAGWMRGAINRIYYAIFYAAGALALAKGFSTTSHAQLRGYINREFVKTGLIPLELGRAYGAAFDSRTKGDYDDLAEFQSEEVRELLSLGSDFVTCISAILNS
jgi:uncharacterized protein (UPF0332 family)